MNILNDVDAAAVASILDVGLPHVYVDSLENAPYVGGMYFLYIKDAKGDVSEIYECRGYHRRRLLYVTDGQYVVVNSLSPFMEGVFQSRQNVTNKYETHPLIEGVYHRYCMYEKDISEQNV